MRIWDAMGLAAVAAAMIVAPAPLAVEAQPSPPADRSAVSSTGQQTVFQAGEAGVDTFRIPAVVRSTQGTVVAFVEARMTSPLDGEPTSMVARRSTDGGATWGPVIVVDAFDAGPEPTCARRDPMPISLDRGSDRGDLVLLYRRCSDGPLVVTRSVDDGVTWSAPVTVDVDPLPGQTPEQAKVIRPGPGHGLQLARGPRAGRLVAPVGRVGGGGPSNVAIVYSDDGGRTWETGPTAPGAGGEVAVVELADATLLVSSRRGDGRRTFVRFGDGGEVVLPAGGTPDEQAAVADRIAGSPAAASVLAVPDCDELIHTAVADPGVRRGVRLWRSTDRGETWHPGPLLVDGPAAYTDLVALDDVGERFAMVVETGERNSNERIDLVTFDRGSIDDAPAPLAPDADVATLASGFLDVDGVRFSVVSYCVSGLEGQVVRLENGELESDLSADLSTADVRGVVRPPGAEPIGFAATVPISDEAGLSFEGQVLDTDDIARDVRFVMVNFFPCRDTMPAVDLSDPLTAPVCAAGPEVPDPAAPDRLATPAQPVAANPTFTG